MQARWLAGCAGVTLLLVVLVLALGVLSVTVNSFGQYCEDWGFCLPGKPVPATLVGLVGLVGLGAGLSIVSRLLFYAFDDYPPEGLLVRGVVMVASAAAWLTIVQVADLRGFA